MMITHKIAETVFSPLSLCFAEDYVINKASFWHLNNIEKREGGKITIIVVHVGIFMAKISRDL